MTPLLFLSLSSYFRYGSGWNLILLILLGCSTVSVAIFIERLWSMRGAAIDTQHFLIKLRDLLTRGEVVAAVEACDADSGAVSRMVKAGLTRYERPQEHIESAMEISGRIEIAQLEKNAKILSLIAHLAPLIGLLGTVLGFIQAFAEMRMSGLIDISATRLGEAMEYALVTTAAGLVVAIPSTLGYNYLVSRIEGFVLEMQTTSSEVIDLLQQHPYR